MDQTYEPTKYVIKDPKAEMLLGKLMNTQVTKFTNLPWITYTVWIVIIWKVLTMLFFSIMTRE